MDWITYQKIFKIKAKKRNYPEEFIESSLKYARTLFDNHIPIIYDIEHFSKLIGYKPSFIYYVTNKPKKHYRTYKIPKHNGKFRLITEPYPDLKNIQKWILNNILIQLPTSPYAKAYKPMFSLKDNARFHIKQAVVIKLDVADFFPSIKIPFVVHTFLKLGYSKELSEVLGRLCCVYNCLPQGAPTSPYISNLFCLVLDKRIGNYITKLGFRYTRYSDDITISGNISNNQIASIIKFCRKCLKDCGLSLNEEKTQILRNHHRQLVTGIVLNDKISAGTKKKKDIRKQIYYIKQYGLESHIAHEKIEKQNYIYHLAGLINWVLFLEKNNEEFLEYKKYINEIIKRMGSNEKIQIRKLKIKNKGTK